MVLCESGQPSPDLTFGWTLHEEKLHLSAVQALKRLIIISADFPSWELVAATLQVNAIDAQVEIWDGQRVRPVQNQR